MLPPPALARLDARVRPLLARFAPSLAVRIYSAGRGRFLDRLIETGDRVEAVEPPEGLERTLWGVRFRSPLGNAAGMFKNGHGYRLCLRQGAGYFLAGTTTAAPRSGNRRAGVSLPFAPYPRSGAASNWLGLPNEGHAAVAERLAGVVRYERIEGCPIGISLAATPGAEDPVRTEDLLDGIARYADAGVDFLEINESCPNTEDGEDGAGGGPLPGLRERLERLADRFLAPRRERPPVLVKFSVDTDPGQIGPLVDLLTELGFDGIDFGNTSTAYGRRRSEVDPRERRLYDHFTDLFGGGVSGRPLKRVSLDLSGRAVERAGAIGASGVHVLRTGGIETGADLAASERAGIALDGWYTGYFEALARHGHALYRTVYDEALEELERD